MTTYATQKDVTGKLKKSGIIEFLNFRSKLLSDLETVNSKKT